MNVELNKVNILMNETLERILKWIKKANNSGDKFDEYLSLFIATNMTYNLWERFWRKKRLFYPKDKESFFALKRLIKNKAIFNNRDKRELTEIFNEEQLQISFQKKNKETRKYEEIDARILLMKITDYERTNYAFDLLYVARCNLVHGEKGYESRQIRFLSLCSKIIRRILKESLLQIVNLCKNEYYSPEEHLRKIENLPIEI